MGAFFGFLFSLAVTVAVMFWVVHVALGPTRDRLDQILVLLQQQQGWTPRAAHDPTVPDADDGGPPLQLMSLAELSMEAELNAELDSDDSAPEK